MDPKKIVRNGRAFGVNEVKAQTDYIDKNYELSCYSSSRITSTGRLEVAALKPRAKSLPEFTFRWDEKANTLDVDIVGVSDDVKRDFEEGRRGYSGHHPKRLSKDKIFQVFIETPKGVIFRGRLMTPLHRELGLSGSMQLSGKLTARKIPRDAQA